MSAEHPPRVRHMLDERAALADRLAKLGSFLFVEQFNELQHDEQADLLAQAEAMLGYSAALNRRIARALPAPPAAAEAATEPDDPWTAIDPDNPESWPAKGEWLVTVETDGGREVHVLLHEGCNRWRHEGEFTFQHGYHFRPIAWAPVPAAYAGS